MPKKYLKYSGFTLTELLVVTGIGTVLAVVVVAVLSQTAVFQGTAMARSQIDLVRTEIVRLVTNKVMWNQTVAGPLNSSSLACLRLHSPCTRNGNPAGAPLTNQPFILYSSSTNVFIDSIAQNAGLTFQGMPCTGYSDTGNDQCPFRYALTWSAICSPSNCTDPLIKVSATFSFSPKSARNAINPAAYNLTLYAGSGTAAPPPVPVPPVCNSLVHQANDKSFTVDWTAGSGNGLCRLEYQRPNGSWSGVSVPASVNCDAAGNLTGAVSVPGDGWLGAAWSLPVPIRLVRTSDNAVMCTLGSLTCIASPGSSSLTPMKDEDCDNRWDNTQVTSCQTSTPLSITPGDTYDCDATITIPGAPACGTLPFRYAHWLAQAALYSDTACTVETFASANILSAYEYTQSGTVPSIAQLPNNGVPATYTHVPISPVSCIGTNPLSGWWAGQFTKATSAWLGGNCSYAQVPPQTIFMYY